MQWIVIYPVDSVIQTKAQVEKRESAREARECTKY